MFTNGLKLYAVYEYYISRTVSWDAYYYERRPKKLTLGKEKKYGINQIVDIFGKEYNTNDECAEDGDLFAKELPEYDFRRYFIFKKDLKKLLAYLNDRKFYFFNKEDIFYK